MAEPKVCPTCGLPVMDFDAPPIDRPTCNPIRQPDCWKITGISRNGGPLLQLVDPE